MKFNVVFFFLYHRNRIIYLKCPFIKLSLIFALFFRDFPLHKPLISSICFIVILLLVILINFRVIMK